MPQTYTTLPALFTAIANAIRAKTGGTAEIVADDFPTAIANIPSGGGSIIPSDLPSDGKTRIGYTIPEGASATGKKIVLRFIQDNANVTVDWGDGSTETTATDSSGKTLEHTYATTGDKIVSLKVNTGTIYFGNGNSSTIYGSYSTNSYLRNYIKWAVLGNNVTKLGNYAFYYCICLQEIRFPSSGFTEIGTNVFDYCASLKSVSLPSSVTTVGTSAFTRCYSMAECTIPGNITTVSNSIFNNAQALLYFNVPSTVTTLGTSCFASAVGLQKLRFNSATPPSAASNSFTAVTTACIISVPTGKLSAYTGAANYPPSGSYTYIEESS